MWSISSSCLLILIMYIWRDPGSCPLVFYNPHQVDFTRSRILSSCLFVLMKSTWQYPISRLLDCLDEVDLTIFSISSAHPREFDLTSYKIKDLVFLSSRPNQVELIRNQYLVFSSPHPHHSSGQQDEIQALVFSSSSSRIDSELQDLVFSSSHPLTRSTILSSCLFDLILLSSWLLFSSDLDFV